MFFFLLPALLACTGAQADQNTKALPGEMIYSDGSNSVYRIVDRQYGNTCYMARTYGAIALSCTSDTGKF